MKSYDTLTDALNDLKKSGYEIDFNLYADGSKCVADNLQSHPEDFVIKENRFEGTSDPR